MTLGDAFRLPGALPTCRPGQRLESISLTLQSGRRSSDCMRNGLVRATPRGHRTDAAAFLRKQPTREAGAGAIQWRNGVSQLPERAPESHA